MTIDGADAERRTAEWRAVGLVILALIGLGVSLALAAFQLGIVNGVWDPIFGNGAQRVLTSPISRALPVPDAVIGAAAYVVEGAMLLTDIEEPLNIRYLAQITDTTLFSPTFVAALAARIADEVCEVITKSTTRRERLQIEYRARLMQARRSDQMGRAPQPVPDGSWVDSRQ